MKKTNIFKNSPLKVVFFDSEKDGFDNAKWKDVCSQINQALSENIAIKEIYGKYAIKKPEYRIADMKELDFPHFLIGSDEDCFAVQVGISESGNLATNTYTYGVDELRNISKAGFDYIDSCRQKGELVSREKIFNSNVYSTAVSIAGIQTINPSQSTSPQPFSETNIRRKR